MDEVKKSKITRFVDDKTMSDAVYDVLLKIFLKKKPGASAEILAASFLAVNQLEDAWSELKKLRSETDRESKPLNQVGL